MTTLDQIWANTSAEGNTEDKPAPAGTVGVFRISGYRAGKSKKGELYFAIDVVDDAQGYNWGIYKQFTKNGQPHEGSIKSAKITLRQLGIEVQSPSQLDAVLGPIVGRFYAYEQVASDRLNTVTGQPYVNTNITGVASAPTLNVAPVQAQAAPAPAVAAPTQVQTPQGVAQFPAAVATPDPWPQPQQQVAVAGQTLDQALTAAGLMQQQVQAAVAQPIDQHPFS
jgi:hypothetical protein